ncbi:MAG: putative protein YqgN [bacterium]|nr:putative protein YqgN [bacterium]
MSALAEKAWWRARIREQRRLLDPAWRDRASAQILAHVEALPVFRSARIIHTYVALPHEVDTLALIRRLLSRGHQVAVPKVESDNTLQHFYITDFSALQAGVLGILEPAPEKSRRAPPAQFDLVIVPGLAFDHAGNRLGAGKGYYDRFLTEVTAPKIALAFAFQIIDKVPIAPHDQRVDMIMTEDGLIVCS